MSRKNTHHSDFVDVDDSNLVPRIPPYEDEPGYGVMTEVPVSKVPAEIAEEKAIAVLMDELGSNSESSVSVHRVRNGRASGPYLFRFHPLDRKLPDVLDELRDEYGTGDYQIVISDGSQVIKGGRRNVSVEAKKSGTLSTAAPTSTPANDMMTLIAVMREESAQRDRERQAQYERDREREEARREREQAREDARLAREADRQLEMMKMLTVTKKDDGVFDKFMAAVNTKMIQDMMSPKQNSLTQVKELLEVTSLLNPNGGEETVMQTFIKAFAKPAEDIAKALPLMAATQRTPNPLPPKLPVTPGALPAPAPQPAGAVPDELLALLRMVERAAAQDLGPETYADLILDQLGDANAAMLFRSDDNIQHVLAQINPKILEAKLQWFVDLRRIVLELLDDTGAESEPAPPVAETSEGNALDAGEHDETISDAEAATGEADSA